MQHHLLVEGSDQRNCPALPDEPTENDLPRIVREIKQQIWAYAWSGTGMAAGTQMWRALQGAVDRGAVPTFTFYGTNDAPRLVDGPLIEVSYVYNPYIPRIAEEIRHPDAKFKRAVSRVQQVMLGAITKTLSRCFLESD
jgi:hypothetical protein